MCASSPLEPGLMLTLVPICNATGTVASYETLFSTSETGGSTANRLRSAGYVDRWPTLEEASSFRSIVYVDLNREL
jgi:hypothetical protein